LFFLSFLLFQLHIPSLCSLNHRGQAFASADMSASAGYVGSAALYLEESDSNGTLVTTRSLQAVLVFSLPLTPPHSRFLISHIPSLVFLARFNPCSLLAAATSLYYSILIHASLASSHLMFLVPLSCLASSCPPHLFQHIFLTYPYRTSVLTKV
jgi:hypothetical protein